MQVNLEQKSNTMKKIIRKFIKEQIKALHESKKHVVKYSKSNNTYQVWLGDEIVTDFATKEKANAKAKNLNDLQNAKDVDKAQLKKADLQVLQKTFNILGQETLVTIKNSTQLTNVTFSWGEPNSPEFQNHPVNFEPEFDDADTVESVWATVSP